MVKAKKRVLFVEGGGDQNPSLASECRRAFSMLFERAGVKRRPKVVACGGRKRAFDQFCVALAEAKDDVWLLVDAEEPVAGASFDPWAHVKARPGDGWERPGAATDEQLHLMTVTMETWLVADRAALTAVFGSKLDASKLPAEGAALETKTKAAINTALQQATKPTKAGPYGKGAHSFKVLAQVSPDKLRALAWGQRLLDAMGAS